MPERDPRFEKINELFINYSQGNFDYQVELSPKLDEIDAFISNINMLGEELKATTISKNYFNNIFNSVSDIIFIMEKSGKMRDINTAGYVLFGYCPEKKEEINVFDLFQNEKELFAFQEQLEKSNSVVNIRSKLKDKSGKGIECMISANKMEDKGTGMMGYQGIIKDMTQEMEMENLVRRTIVDAQEKERKRFSVDLHDSLGIRLTGIKFMLATLRKKNKLSDKKQSGLLLKSKKEVDYVSGELRNICFDLMPSTLEKFGLTYSIQELCKRIGSRGKLKFNTLISEKFPVLLGALEIAIFRIIQEFINNSIKHGKAKMITIKMCINDAMIDITLQDDGVGFDKNKLNKFAGMGLKNVQSRVRSYNGDVEIESAPGKGTTYHILLPVQPKANEKN